MSLTGPPPSLSSTSSAILPAASSTISSSSGACPGPSRLRSSARSSDATATPPIRASCTATSWPSRVRLTSNSTISQPSSIASDIACNEFCGAACQVPRCAATSAPARACSRARSSIARPLCSAPVVADSFLILMADQLAARWLPFYGHPVVQAPHLSALASDATVFDAAYSAYPLCAPSRAAMLTGRLASSIGVYDNAAELRATEPTVAHFLRAAGYRTVLAGKTHFIGPDQLHGFERRLTTDIYPADVDWTPDWSRPLDQPLPWYHTMKSVLNPGVCAASMQTDYDEEVSFQAVRALHDLAREGDATPFLLFVSFTNPHDPWEIPSRHWDRYRPEEIDDPVVG